MRIKILGSGTLNPSLDRGSPAYLVEAHGVAALVDIGPAVTRRLVEFGFSPDEIDVIVMTHFHVDHTADLATFLFVANYGATARTRPLFLIGGPGTHRFVRALSHVYPWIKPKSYHLKIISLPKGEWSLGGLKIKTARMNHNRESIAVRFEDGKTATFSGDTDYCAGLARLAFGTDLLVADCACPERKMEGHLNLFTLERIVRKASPKMVILSHLYPDWKEFHGVLHAPYLLAEDGLEIDL